MFFRKFVENTGGKLIVVDVQPEYAHAIHFMEDFARLVSEHSEVLVLYNGPDFGYEDKHFIARWYYENGVPAEAIRRMKWHEKNYSFFRDLMDTGWDREHIIRFIRYMLAKKIWDWREIPSRVADRIGEKLGVDANKETRETFSLFVPELARILRKWNGADICGGGCNECLAEVIILMDALKLNYHLLNRFVY